MCNSPHDFGPTACWEILWRRGKLLQVVRRFFDERQFLEVETPVLSHDSVVDRHLDRVMESAWYFDIPVDLAEVEATIKQATDHLGGGVGAGIGNIRSQLK